MAAPAVQAVTLNLTAILGYPSTSNINVSTYTAPTSFTASFGLKTTVHLAASTSDIAVNLATLFPGLTTVNGIFVKDVTLAGNAFSVSSNATGTRTAIQAAGFWGCTPNNIAPPILYFNNAVAAIASIEIGVLGS